MKKSILVFGSVLALAAGLVAFKGDKDRLHKREFTVEVIEGTKPKGKPDEIAFKDGKVYPGDIAMEKMGVTWIRYELKKDSTYMEDDMEKEYIEVYADSDLEKGEKFEFTCIVEDYGIEGTMKLMKGDKIKKTFTFSGKEKPKKSKKKDKEEK